MTAGIPLMKNVPTPFLKSILIPLGLTAECLQQMQLFKKKKKKIHGSGITALIISN